MARSQKDEYKRPTTEIPDTITRNIRLPGFQYRSVAVRAARLKIMEQIKPLRNNKKGPKDTQSEASLYLGINDVPGCIINQPSTIEHKANVRTIGFLFLSGIISVS